MNPAGGDCNSQVSGLGEDRVDPDKRPFLAQRGHAHTREKPIQLIERRDAEQVRPLLDDGEDSNSKHQVEKPLCEPGQAVLPGTDIAVKPEAEG